MDEQAYQYWQVLHRRVVMGETLSAAEQAVYEAGCEELDAEERLDGNSGALAGIACTNRCGGSGAATPASTRRRNSTLVSPPWKPAWTHGRANSSALETKPHGASQTADSSRTLRFLLWVLWRFRGGCRRGVDSGSFLPGVSEWRRQR